MKTTAGLTASYLVFVLVFFLCVLTIIVRVYLI